MEKYSPCCEQNRELTLEETRLAGSPLGLRLAPAAGVLIDSGRVWGRVIADARVVALWDRNALRRVCVVVLSELAVRRRLQVVR